jgi:putative phosphoesterase
VLRVAVIADTHMPRGARRLPDACVERLSAADLVLHAGDLVTRGVLEELRGLGPPVEAVPGNMDEPELKELLLAERVIEVDGARIGMLHDAGPRTGRQARLAARFPDCHAVVYAHTHMPHVERFQHLWILNPGSPTERRSSPHRSMLVLRVDGEEVEPELVPL